MKKASLTSADSVLSQLQRIVRLAAQQASEDLKAMDLSLQEFRLLGCLVGETGLSQKDLAARLSVSPPTLSVAVKRLEEKGMLERITDPADKRSKLLKLPDDMDFAASNRLLRSVEERMLQGLGRKEQDQLQFLLSRVADNLNSEP